MIAVSRIECLPRSGSGVFSADVKSCSFGGDLGVLGVSGGVGCGVSQPNIDVVSLDTFI